MSDNPETLHEKPVTTEQIVLLGELNKSVEVLRRFLMDLSENQAAPRHIAVSLRYLASVSDCATHAITSTRNGE